MNSYDNVPTASEYSPPQYSQEYRDTIQVIDGLSRLISHTQRNMNGPLKFSPEQQTIQEGRLYQLKEWRVAIEEEMTCTSWPWREYIKKAKADAEQKHLDDNTPF